MVIKIKYNKQADVENSLVFKKKWLKHANDFVDMVMTSLQSEYAYYRQSALQFIEIYTTQTLDEHQDQAISFVLEQRIRELTPEQWKHLVSLEPDLLIYCGAVYHNK